MMGASMLEGGMDASLSNNALSTVVLEDGRLSSATRSSAPACSVTPPVIYGDAKRHRFRDRTGLGIGVWSNASLSHDVSSTMVLEDGRISSPAWSSAPACSVTPLVVDSDAKRRRFRDFTGVSPLVVDSDSKRRRFRVFTGVSPPVVDGDAGRHRFRDFTGFGIGGWLGRSSRYERAP